MKKIAPPPPPSQKRSYDLVCYMWISKLCVYTVRLNTQNQQHGVPFTIRCNISLLYGNNISFIALH